MKTKLATAAILLSIGVPASAHRLDEYLQATLISVEQNRVQAQIRLTPGVAVLPFVLSIIDKNADGVISESERQLYAERVLADLSLTVDGNRLRPVLASTKFPAIEEMKEGLGEIQLEFSANLPRNAANRRLEFANHHQSRIAAYLVNCLVPGDPDIRILAQHRNESQSLYRLDYTQAGVQPDHSDSRVWLGAAALLLFARIAFLSRHHAQKMTLSSR